MAQEKGLISSATHLLTSSAWMCSFALGLPNGSTKSKVGTYVDRLVPLAAELVPRGRVPPVLIEFSIGKAAVISSALCFDICGATPTKRARQIHRTRTQR